MKLRRFFAGLAAVAGFWASSQAAHATMYLPMPDLGARVNFVGKDGMIVEGTVTAANHLLPHAPADPAVHSLGNPTDWDVTECVVQGEVIKGSEAFGYQASQDAQEVRVNLYGYGTVNIKGAPTCEAGEKGMFFFYGLHPTTKLSSFAYGPQGIFMYQQVDGQTLAFDGYKNMTLHLNTLQNTANKSLGVNAKYLSSVKALAVDANDPSKGLHPDALKSVVSEMVKAYYVPAANVPATATTTTNQSPH